MPAPSTQSVEDGVPTGTVGPSDLITVSARFASSWVTLADRASREGEAPAEPHLKAGRLRARELPFKFRMRRECGKRRIPVQLIDFAEKLLDAAGDDLGLLFLSSLQCLLKLCEFFGEHLGLGDLRGVAFVERLFNEFLQLRFLRRVGLGSQLGCQLLSALIHLEQLAMQSSAIWVS